MSEPPIRDGSNVQQITANPARDVYPRFSPDGKWIAFSSDRDGNLDVYIVPTEGGQPKQLTFHSADDNVLGWTPDSHAVLFSSNRGEDFMPRLYLVNMEAAMSAMQALTWACMPATPRTGARSRSIVSRKCIGGSITAAPTTAM